MWYCQVGFIFLRSYHMDVGWNFNIFICSLNLSPIARWIVNMSYFWLLCLILKGETFYFVLIGIADTLRRPMKFQARDVESCLITCAVDIWTASYSLIRWGWMNNGWCQAQQEPMLSTSPYSGEVEKYDGVKGPQIGAEVCLEIFQLFGGSLLWLPCFVKPSIAHEIYYHRICILCFVLIHCTFSSWIILAVEQMHCGIPFAWIVVDKSRTTYMLWQAVPRLEYIFKWPYNSNFKAIEEQFQVICLHMEFSKMRHLLSLPGFSVTKPFRVCQEKKVTHIPICCSCSMLGASTVREDTQRRKVWYESAHHAMKWMTIFALPENWVDSMTNGQYSWWKCYKSLRLSL